MFRRDARTDVGSYVRLARRIVGERIPFADIHSEITGIGKRYPIEQAVKELRGSNCYEGWQDELRYFMFRYEEHLTRDAGNDFENEQWEKIWLASPSKSIEHIISQSKASNEIKHTLGNLMILPPNLNSRLQDKSPGQKLRPYRETGLLSAIEVASTTWWKKAAVRARENDLLMWAAEEWGD